ncbi:MAG: phosphoribosylamine--glycine ligase [Terriglobia bacterium]
MKILLIGSGGREHALAWKLRRSASVTKVYAVPGNPGIAGVAHLEIENDYVNLSERLKADLTVVGPEAPLVAGIVDRFRQRGLNIVGPTAENAALEGSKVHSKRFMKKLGVATARFEVVENPEGARSALRQFRYPVVLKTDGLAAGKGVVIAQNAEEAEIGLTQLAYPLVMEEFLEGREVSFIALCDGKRAVALEPSQDHKRIFDNDLGPNTGGMGAYSDSRILSEAQRSTILDTIIQPVVEATSFTGFLYAGLMMTADGPSVLEFNVRMGDPETQPLMMRLESDWGEVLMAAARGALPRRDLDWTPEPATCVVLAAKGYPGAVEAGQTITGIEDVDNGAVVFQAGTQCVNGALIASGGRVLGVTARGTDLKDSIERAYAAVAHIHFEGMQYRLDIGAKGLATIGKTSGT